MITNLSRFSLHRARTPRIPHWSLEREASRDCPGEALGTSKTGNFMVMSRYFFRLMTALALKGGNY